MSIKKKILIAACAAATLLLVLLFAWIRGAFLPEYVKWNETESAAAPGAGSSDSSGNDEDPLELVLKNKSLRVRSGGSEIFKTPATWLVSDALTGDIDGDGGDELLLLLWKHGEYMKATPFWDKGSRFAFSQHIFIYDLEDGEVSPKWMASRLPHPVTDWHLDLSDRVCIKDPDGNESTWQWHEFGLQLVEHPRNKVSMIAVGDNLAHESIYSRCYDKTTDTFDFDPIYADVRDKISSYDIAVVNQETIFVEDDSAISDFPQFGTPTEMGDALANAGFNVVLHATNHVNDKGIAAIDRTLAYWKENHPEVTVLGINETPAESISDSPEGSGITYIEKNGIKLALFNYTEHLNGHNPPEEYAYKINTFANIDKLYSDLEKAENECDFSVCFLHAGEEYSTEPTEELKDIIAKLTDAGADIIICTHPHILQDCEEVMTDSGNIAVVYYSLGNFMSGQTAPGTDTGGAAVLTIEKDSSGETYITDYSLLTTECLIDSDGIRVCFNY